MYDSIFVPKTVGKIAYPEKVEIYSPPSKNLPSSPKYPPRPIIIRLRIAETTSVEIRRPGRYHYYTPTPASIKRVAQVVEDLVWHVLPECDGWLAIGRQGVVK